MSKLDKCIYWTSHTYNLLWVIVMWCPYVFYYKQDGSIVQMFNQLTWWCWSLQTIFYTSMHFATSPFYKCLHKYKCYIKIPYIEYLIPDVIILYGMVSGIVWYVFMYFCYVLFKNPDLILKEMEKRSGSDGFIQIANILIHYYIVSSVFIWSLYMYKPLSRMMKSYTTTNFRKFKFCTVWFLYLLIYFCYWKFDINGIMKNYHLDDVALYVNVLAGLGISFLVIINNLITMSILME